MQPTKKLAFGLIVGTAAAVGVLLAVRYSARRNIRRASLSPVAHFVEARMGAAVTTHGVLPGVFASVLPEIKAKSHIPVLLPGKLPLPIAKAKHAIVEKAGAGEYAISLWYKLDVGDAGFAAFFVGQSKPTYDLRELGGTRDVKLAHEIHGAFRPVSCGGSCAPANLWWEEGGVLYQIQLKLSPALSEQIQQRTMVAVADSAILAGPR